MKYTKISVKRRTELIQRVVTNGESVTVVARRLGINESSAKSIVRTYKKTGVVLDKQMSKQANRLKRLQKRRKKRKSEVKVEEVEEKVQNTREKRGVESVKPQNEQKIIDKKQGVIEQNQISGSNPSKRAVSSEQQLLQQYPIIGLSMWQQANFKF